MGTESQISSIQMHGLKRHMVFRVLPNLKD